jgi:multidrug efflux system membrane fusion protein
LEIKRIEKMLVFMVAVSILVFNSCKKGDGSAPQGKRGGSSSDRSRIQYPVEVEPVKIQSLVYTVGAVGSIDAFEKVQVTARVSGVVDRVLFAEGNTVAVDQVLVEIEPERYRLTVEAAQASYDKALASKADAEAGLKRRETVINQTPGLIPGEELETWRTKVRLATADVAQSLATLNQAKLNLHDAYVRAPLSGILQTRTVQTGEYVQVGTVMATLVRRDPLLLRFRVPERDASQIRPGMSANFNVRDDARDFSSKIVHVADAADEVSRMVSITAEIRDSKDPVLRPGAFAEITIPVSTSRSSPVIPQIAIRPSERGFIAFIVENDTAVERVVTLGMRTSDGQVEVLSGLKEGEVLVVRGAEALLNGVPVRTGKPQAPDEKPSEKKPKSR